MAPAGKATILKRAVARCVKLDRELCGNVHLVLDARTVKCDDGCPGWFVGDRGVEVCDDCARSNGYATHVSDAMVALLPEAQSAQSKRDSNASQDQPTRDEVKILAWLRGSVRRHLRTDELVSNEAVRFAAHLLKVTPAWIAESMVKAVRK
jgi:hypothetical protein